MSARTRPRSVTLVSVAVGWLAVCALATMAAPTSSPDRLQVLPQNRFDRWSSDDVLPAAQVYEITQSQDGYIWTATLDGLVRYDGVRFTTFNSGTTDAIADSRFTSVFVDSRGALWAGTEFRNVYRLSGGSWQSWKLPPAPSNTGFVRSIAEDADGVIWCFAGSEAYKIEEAGPVLFSSPVWERLAAGQDLRYAGRFGIVAPGGMLAIVEGHLRVLTSNDGAPNLTDAFAFKDRAERMFVVSRDGTFYAVSGGHFQAIAPQGAFARVPAGGPLVGLLEDRKGAVWFERSTDLRLERLASDGSVSTFATSSGFDDSSTAMFEDTEGTLWFGGLHGLYRYRGELVSYVGQKGSAPLTVFDVVGQNQDGEILMATYDGKPYRYGTPVRRCTLGVWRGGALAPIVTVALPPGTFGSPPLALESREGSIWFALSTDLYRVRSRAIVPLSPRGALSVSQPIDSLVEDHDGTIWVGTGDGIYGVRDGAVQRFGAEDGLASSDVHNLLVARDGALWCATYGGVSRIQGGAIASFNVADGLPSDHVRSLYEDADGCVWAGTVDGGLGRIKDGRVTKVTQREGLFNNGVFGIVEDDAGDLWMSCNRGIYRARRMDLEAVSDGRSRRVDCVVYGVTDGMRVAECNGGNQASARRLADGKLYFDSQGGLVVVDPLARPRLSSPPPVVIESVVRDGEPVVAGDTLEIRPGQESFEIQFAAPSFVKSEYVRFRYRLEGLEAEWVETGDRRSALYSRIPPGEYTFTVVAANADGIWNVAGARLRVVVVPPFWRTYWFYALVAGLVALVGYAAFRRHIASLERRYEAEQERLRRTADELEDHVRARTSELESEVVERRRAEEEAEAANRAKSVFLANMSHELRTPLNAVLGFAQLMERERDRTTRDRAHLAQIQRSGEHLLSLINDVLSIAKIEAGRLVVVTGIFDLRQLVADIGAMVRVRAEAKGLRVVVEPDASLPQITSGDEGKLRQVLINLLANAVKFTDTGLVTLRVRWSDGRAFFDVEDTGCGIAPADLEAIFEAFAQSDAGRQTEGTGLGLTISRQFIRLMGGEIRVESEPWRGSRFSFDVPLLEAGETPAEHADRTVVGLEPGQSTPRILVVDDMSENRELLVELLRLAGLEVSEDSNGRDAIETIGAWRPHLVFLDWRMPVMDGRATVERVRSMELTLAPRIVALTASAFDHDREAILACGCDGFITKPFRAEAVFDEINAQLGVRFVYAAADGQTREERVLNAERLAALPEEVTRALYRTLSLGDDGAALAVVGTIVGVDPALARDLERKLREFAIEEVLHLLEIIQ